MNANNSRPEAAEYVISGEDVDTIQHYTHVNLWIVVFSSFFLDNLNQHNAETTVGLVKPHFRGQGAKCKDYRGLQLCKFCTVW